MPIREGYVYSFSYNTMFNINSKVPDNFPLIKINSSGNCEVRLHNDYPIFLFIQKQVQFYTIIYNLKNSARLGTELRKCRTMENNNDNK